MYQREIETVAGVISADDEPGEVMICVPDGSTLVELKVTDSSGATATVYLDYRQLTSLMISLGSAGGQL